MHRSIRIQIILGGLSLFWVAQCDQDKSVAPRGLPTGSIRIEAQVADESPAPEAAAKVPVAQGRLRVSGEGMVTRDTLLTVQGGRLVGQVDQIPVGLRKVALFLLEAGGDTLWKGETEVTVQANSIATATILLERVGDQAPQASFSVSPELGGLRTVFRVQAQVEDTHDPMDSLQVRWDFENDGRFETDWTSDKDTTHVFGAAGNYRIALEVRDRSGKTSSLTKQVQVIAPIAVASDTLRIIPTGNLVTLDGRQSTGVEGQALVFHWSQVLDHPQGKQVSVMGTFTDNNTSTAGLVSFEPRAGRGLYVFTLTVEVAGVQSDPDTVHVFVVSARPTAQVDTPASVRVGESLTLKGQASDADDALLQYRWRGERVGLLSDSTIASPVFTPDQEGVYRYQFVAIDADPQESEPAEVVITVKPANRPPVAKAGPDQEVEVGAEVVLDGSGSTDADGDSLRYLWAGPAGISLSSTTVSQPRFTASTAGTYQFSLVVNDGLADSPTDMVVVQVNEPVVSPPPNTPPVADAGPDQEVEVGAVVVLDGSRSSDADGDALTYQWTAPAGISLSSTTVPQPRFTATTAGTYRFSLVVNDGQVDSQPDTVVVQVKETVVVPPPNTPPVANAGPDQTVEVGAEVVLDGSGSSDEDGDTLSYRWIAPADVSLSSEDVVQPHFTALASGSYIFGLVVSDSSIESVLDEVSIVVNPTQLPSNKTMTVDLPGGAEMEFVWVDPGMFVIGSPESEPGRNSDEGPQRLVKISKGYWLGKYELTQEQWEAVMGNNPSDIFIIAEPNLPVNMISWIEVQGFVHLLNEASGDSLYRLPTEAEWEYACRAGTNSTWSFGNDSKEIGDYAWFKGNASGTQVVGKRLPNSWGLYDMSGNVEEWCQDWYASGYRSQSSDATGPASGSTRVLRGGSFISNAESTRSAYRKSDSPGSRRNHRGARLLRIERENPSGANSPPESSAGPDQEVEMGSVVLDGSGSTDADEEGRPNLEYEWRSLDGAVLSSTAEVRPQFNADSPGAFRFVLVVNDGQDSSEPDTVVVAVLSMPRLVFSSSRDGDWEIYSANLDGSDLVQLTNDETDDMRPKVAPDGLSIVFTSFRDGNTDPWTGLEAGDIYWMEPEGTGQLNLTQSTNHDDEPALSSSNRLAFSSTSGLDSLGNAFFDIYTMDVDGNNPNKLTDNTGRNTQPSWSPDGKKIAFTGLRQGEALSDIYLMNADGSGLVNLTNTPDVEEGEPAWSPDDTRIAFVSNQNGDTDIYVMGIDGSGLVNLTQEAGLSADDYSPAWSPDGKSIAYVSLNDPGSDIYMMNADGSDPRAVVEDAQDPAWLPGR